MRSLSSRDFISYERYAASRQEDTRQCSRFLERVTDVVERHTAHHLRELVPVPAATVIMVLARLSLLSIGLAASARAAGTAQQAFVASSPTSFFAVPRHSGRTPQQPSGRRRPRSIAAPVMSTLASETAVADAAGGVETRTWKWNGYNIRYQVASEVRCF